MVAFSTSGNFFFFKFFLKKGKRVDLEQFLQVTSREGYFPVGKQTGMFQEETRDQ